MFTLNSLNAARAGTTVGRSLARHALHIAMASSGAILLVACGLGGGSTSAIAPSPGGGGSAGNSCASAISNATGKWVTIVNNSYTPPGDPSMNFFSFNQPSVNSSGEVVFRGRAKLPGGSGTGGGEPHRGVWAVDLCASPALQTVVDNATLVPDPNNLGVTFTETPSIPRIDISSRLLATRGNSQPAWDYIDPVTQLETRAGTTGIFTWINGPVMTGASILGNVPEFSYFQVPGALPGTKFDVFPGSPTASNGKYIAFKGNYTDLTDPALPVSKTGVYFRDISVPASPIILIADSNTLIPGQTVTFGSTAPPSAANGKIVFTGLDIENAPRMGGIYVAPLADHPPLTAIAQIGDTVPDRNGVPLADGSTFTTFGEGLAYDGRYVAFWAAWGTAMQNITLTCPSDGNKDVIAYCNLTYPPVAPATSGTTTMPVSVNQGIFLHDTVSGKTLMVARAGTGEAFQDFLYWVYSGAPPVAGSQPTDAEPPRWRSSAFAAVDGARGVIFKGSKSLIAGVTVPDSGIYGVGYVHNALTDFAPVLEVGDFVAKLDPAAPAGSTVLSVGIEREAIRNGWVTLTVSTINAAGDGWAGVYATHVSALSDIPATQ